MWCASTPNLKEGKPPSASSSPIDFPYLSVALPYNFRTHMKLEDYKTVLYRQKDGSWVAEIPAIPAASR
jgi:hypothetical protein